MADRLWAKAISVDWAYKCAVCGKKGTDSHHLIPRQHTATRYDLRNGILLCQHDHIWNADLSPHQSAAGWVLWLEEHHPSKAEWYMNTMESGTYRRFEGTTNAAYYCDVIRRLKEYVEEEDYTRIVGVRFSAWLTEQETKS